jgi:tRNA threonylcarbamoyl adenosine modification protein YeaZ
MILAIDTSSKDSQVILLDNNKKIIDKIAWSKRASQSELTLKNIDKLLAKNDINLNRIDKIVVNQGPLSEDGQEASFTGLKIGISIANSLSFALKKQVFGVSLANSNFLEKLEQTELVSGRQKFIKPVYPKEPNIQLK